jgi:hypothetical protein
MEDGCKYTEEACMVKQEKPKTPYHEQSMLQNIMQGLILGWILWNNLSSFVSP